jgi:predicted acetyltransferase
MCPGLLSTDVGRMAVEQLLELARSCRAIAARSKNKPGARAFLALAERYQVLVTERQKRKQD